MSKETKDLKKALKAIKALGKTPTNHFPGKLDILSAMDVIVNAAKRSELSDDLYKECSKEIKFICKKLDITKEQSVLLSVFVEHSNDSHIFLNEIAEYLGCRTTRMLRLSNEIDNLVERDFIRRARGLSTESYCVPLEVLDAFKRNQPIPERHLENLSLADFFNKIAEFLELVDDDSMDQEIAQKWIGEMLISNRHLSFVEKINGTYKLDERDIFIFIVFCHLFITKADDEITFRDMELIVDSSSMRYVRSEMIEGKNALQKYNLIEWSGDGDFADRESYRLTMEAKREFLDELNIPSLSGNKICRGVLKSTEITTRNLFYSDGVARRIDELVKLLDEEHYRDIHSRLEKQGFRSGFTCLFYGAPGTGKTETVMQLARRTGRDIMRVNFSEIKSQWVGESEKNIKSVFVTYRQKVKTSAIIPILLFNEADAIIGKRQEGAERAVDKMENSIQNIILQEMEYLDGILIATTNLVQNMDTAFERRFLYKIQFDKPTAKVRAAIWHEMLPALDLSEAVKLAERYDFTGGQIENVARHYAIDAILHGDNTPTADSLAYHCDNERIVCENKQIGFSF